MDKIRELSDIFATKKGTPPSNTGRFVSLVLFPILVGVYSYFLFIDVNAGIKVSNMEVATKCPSFHFTCAPETAPYGCEVAPAGKMSKGIFAADGNKHLHNGIMKPGEQGNFVLCPGYTDGLDISLRASQNFNPEGTTGKAAIAASCRAPNRYKNLGIFVGETNGMLYIVDLLTMERKVTFDLKTKLLVSKCSSLCLSTENNMGGAGGATLISCDGKIIAVNPSFEKNAQTTARIVKSIDKDFQATTGFIDPTSQAAFIGGVYGEATGASNKPRVHRLTLSNGETTPLKVKVTSQGSTTYTAEITQDVQASMLRYDNSKGVCVKEDTSKTKLGNGRYPTKTQAECAAAKTDTLCSGATLSGGGSAGCTWYKKTETYNFGYFGDNDGKIYFISDVAAQAKTVVPSSPSAASPHCEKLDITNGDISATTGIGSYGAITAFGNNEEEDHAADHVMIGTSDGVVLAYNAEFNKKAWKATLTGGQIMVIADDKYAKTRSLIGTNFPGTLYTLNRQNGRITQASDMDGSITTGFITTNDAQQSQAYISTEEGVAMKMTSDMITTVSNGKTVVSGAGKWKHLAAKIGYIRKSEDLHYNGTAKLGADKKTVSDETHFTFPPAGEGQNVYTLSGAETRDVSAKTLNASFLAYDAVAVAGFSQYACQTKQADTYCKRINLAPLALNVLISPQYSTLQVVSIYLAFVFAVIYGLLLICTKTIVREMNLKTVWNANPFSDPNKPPETELTTGRRKSEFRNPMVNDGSGGGNVTPQRRPSELIKKIRSSQKKLLQNNANDAV